MDKKDITVEVADGVLSIKGEKKEERVEKDKNRYYHYERSLANLSASLNSLKGWLLDSGCCDNGLLRLLGLGIIVTRHGINDRRGNVDDVGHSVPLRDLNEPLGCDDVIPLELLGVEAAYLRMGAYKVSALRQRLFQGPGSDRSPTSTRISGCHSLRMAQFFTCLSMMTSGRRDSSFAVQEQILTDEAGGPSNYRLPSRHTT